MKTKAQKQIMIQDITEKLSRAKSVVFADFTGLTMKQLSDLRNKLSSLDAKLLVTKNTLLAIALKQNNLTIPEEIKSGQTITLFAFEDEITPIKTLVQTLKDAQKGNVKKGFLGQEILEADSILKLASLPGKLELQGKVVGMLNAPLYGLAAVLQGNLNKLVFALEQIKIKRGGEQTSV